MSNCDRCANPKGCDCPYTVENEVRVVDPKTGGEKGAKLQRFSLIPTEFLWHLAEHYGVGARKYEDRNWERGYKWSLSLDAHSRHLSQWLMGETHDSETGSNHLIAAAWHLIALFIFSLRGLGTDDIRAKCTANPLPSAGVQSYVYQDGKVVNTSRNTSTHMEGCRCYSCTKEVHKVSTFGYD